MDTTTTRPAVFLLIGIILAAASLPALAADPVTPYRPGRGKAVGRLDIVQGTVTIQHDGEAVQYLAEAGLPIYARDTIRTHPGSRVRFELNDGSVLTLAANTDLTVTRSIYDPEQEQRSSFVDMTVGKARYWVRKLAGWDEPEFSVKTQTAIIGVRGSDFIVRAGETTTQVTALDQTRLTIVSLAAMEAAPVLLTEFEQTVVELGELPSEVIRISPEEAEQLILEMGRDAEPEQEMDAQDIDESRETSPPPDEASPEAGEPGEPQDITTMPGADDLTDEADDAPVAADLVDELMETDATTSEVDWSTDEMAGDDFDILDDEDIPAPEDLDLDLEPDLDAMDETFVEDDMDQIEAEVEEEVHEIMEEAADERMPELPGPPR